MIMYGNKTRHSRIHLSMEHRLSALEREMSSLRDGVDRLNKLLKEQGDLIAEHITTQMVAAGTDGEETGAIRPEDALFTFVCRQKFDRIEKELAALRRAKSKSRMLHRAG